MKKENTTEKVTDIDYAQCAVPAEGRKGFLTMFMIMLGFTFFSASMWVGQQLAEGLDFYGFIKSLILGGMILGLYTGLLGYVGAKTGLSMDLLAKRAFGEKGSYISSAMISFTQIGWFGVGVAMFAIPVANELLGGSKVAMWGLVIVAGGCMTASAYFGIDSLTLNQLYCGSVGSGSWYSRYDPCSAERRWNDHRPVCQIKRNDQCDRRSRNGGCGCLLCDRADGEEE